MLQYTAKRLLSLIPVLFVVSIVIFSIVHLTPGNPASIMLGEEASQEQIDELSEQLGFNDPIIVQYKNWVLDVLKGDLGYSYFMNDSVNNIIADHFLPTFTLATISIIVAVIIAIPLGVIAANRRGTFLDQTLIMISLIGMAIPSFLLGLLLMMFVAAKVDWLPIAGYRPLAEGLWTHLKYLILPAITLGTMEAALITRMTRTSMLDVLNFNFIKTAKAKGVKKFYIIFKHALRNAFLPILTVIGQSFGVLVAGAVVTETIFNIPGIGQLIINSVERRDYLVIQGIVLFVTLMYLLINLIIDLLYGLIDPRVRLGKR